jgi:hypothetical protein
MLSGPCSGPALLLRVVTSVLHLLVSVLNRNYWLGRAVTGRVVKEGSTRTLESTELFGLKSQLNILREMCGVCTGALISQSVKKGL